jgi:hypothetical protein
MKIRDIAWASVLLLAMVLIFCTSHYIIATIVSLILAAIAWYTL